MTKLPQPRYLNLEWWFAKFFELLEKIPRLILELIEKLKNLNIMPLSAFLSSLLALGIVLVAYKLHRLKRRGIPSYLDFFKGETTPEERSGRWDEIKKGLESEEPEDWKAAIIKADELMDEILITIGYEGEDMAERLKEIEPSDFDNLQNVWEAHKFKELLVKSAEKVSLDKETAKKIIEKYEKALKELKYI